MKTNLKTARVNCNLTQVEVAKRLYVSAQSVYLWEQGRQCVARKHWPRLASLLHLSESELESVLVETLLDACIAKGDARPLLNAQTSRLYDSSMIADALARFSSVSRFPVERHPSTPASVGTRELELREEILRLREENVKLREEILRLREALAASNPDGDGSSTPFNYPSNVRPCDKTETTMR